MAFFTSSIEALISYFHFSLNHWGWAIFALAISIRFIFLPIQLFNFKQQRLMAKIQPELDLLSTLHNEDPLKLFKATGELKKREGSNPGWGIIASLVQIPIFISIYRVFSSMQSLMGGSFAWLSSLAAPDPLFIFPSLVALAGFLQQKVNPPPQMPGNPGMASIMKYMPVVSMLMMVSMPSGLVAYYAASGVLQLAGDYVIRKMLS